IISLATLLCKAYGEGHLTICLALGGVTNRPFHCIVLVQQEGSYDPLPKGHGEKLSCLQPGQDPHWPGCETHLSKPMEKHLGLSNFSPLHPMITKAENWKEMVGRLSSLTDEEAAAQEVEMCSAVQN
uniref:Uncharacterized protein n=1 Tax=Sciurus vulgaris TaxID=55149 RepID=A0A8D2CUM3_SCIVU